MRSQQMNVSLTPDLARFVKGKIRSRKYSNVSEFMQELVRERKERERRRRNLRKTIDPLTHTEVARAVAKLGEEDAETIEAVRQGFDSIERGDCVDINGGQELKDFFADVISRGEKRRAAERRKSARR